MGDIRDRYDFMLIAEATCSRNFDVAQLYHDRYWATIEGNILLSKRYHSPACNARKEIVEGSFGHIEEVEIVQLPLVYVEWDTAEHVGGF